MHCSILIRFLFLSRQVLKQRLEKFQDAMLCRVCMDMSISIAFIPCGHLVCCSECAACVEKCPLCRSQIQHAQQIYLPTCLTATWRLCDARESFRNYCSIWWHFCKGMGHFSNIIDRVGYLNEVPALVPVSFQKVPFHHKRYSVRY